ncbi:MAG: response regulator transcription factor [Chitinophagaceae bacterium]|nr:MAG: response regulator transcription factor [Chitinophagaceae bacterium]
MLPMSFNLKTILYYGAAFAGLILFIKWLQWKLVISGHSMEVFVGLIALVFTVLGIWVARQILRPKVETVIVEKVVPAAENSRPIDERTLKTFDLSSREYEVLQLLCQGFSNAEISEKLFISISTVKTHASNLFVKMDVKSRAKALDKAKRLRIV